MRLAIVAFFSGILMILWLSRLPSAVELLGVFAMMGGCAAIMLHSKNISIARYLGLLIISLLGFLWAVLSAHCVISERISPELFAKDCRVEGEISSLPKHGIYQDSFLFAIKKIEGYQVPVNTLKVQLNAPHKNNRWVVGDEWQFKIKLRAIHGLANPGGLDTEKLFFERRIQAFGAVQNSPQNRLLASSVYHRPIDRFRQYLQGFISNHLNGLALAGIISAITVGDTGGITAEQWEVFRRTGTNHLVAISGLHIALVSGFFYFLVNALWRRFPRWCLHMPARHAALITGLVAGVLYSALAGFSVSTQRAVIMIAVVMGFCLLRRNLLPWTHFLFALLLVLLWNPLVVLSTSFYLSFAAVAIIFYATAGRIAKQETFWWRMGRIQGVVTVCMLPLGLLLFQQLALTSFVANLLAIPWVECVVLPLSLGGALLSLINATLGAWVLILAERAMAILWPFLNYLSSLDALNWQHDFARPWIFFLTVIAMLLLTAPAAMPGRYLGLFYLLPLFFTQAQAPKFGEAWFTLLDVGQGLSAVLQTKNHVLIFDTGARLSEAADMGKRVLLPFLRAKGIAHVNTLVISHGDNDHAGGAEALLKQIKVDQLVSSVPEKFKASKNVLVQPCYQGQAWQWDGVYFQFLNPPIPATGVVYLSKPDNNNSCVLKVTACKTSLLLPGDIEKPAEYFLIHSAADWLKADILVAPHHGSRSSSSPLFVDFLQPHYVLFPVGYHNRYHFPHPAVVERYREIGAQLLDTASLGAISFKLTAQGEGAPVSYRAEHERFWGY